MDRRVTSGVLIAALGLVAGCADTDERPAVRRAAAGASMVACLQHLPSVLNPFVSPDQGSVDLAPLLFTPLVRYGESDSGEHYVPGLAASWEWDPDGTAVRFRLRDDMAWHDGQPVSVADVAWTIEAAGDPTYAYWNGADFAGLVGVSPEEEAGEVLVRFDQPYGPGLEPFATLPIMPRHLLGDVDPETFHEHEYHRAPVGNGPFVLGRRSGQNQLVFEPSPGYPEITGRPHLDRLVVKEIPEVSTILVELRTRTTDLCLTGPSAAREARGVETLTITPAHPGQTQVLLVDHRTPFFDQPEERRALSAAIDRSAIAAVVSPLATPVRSFTPVSWPAPDSLLVPDAAPTLADSLLQAAGWTAPPGAGARQSLDGTTLEFTLLGAQGYEQVLTVLQAQLARAGMRARTQVLEGSAFIDVVLDPERRPPAMVLGLAPSRVHAPDPRSSLHSEGGTNLGGYRSAIADSLIDALSRAPDGPERQDLYRALQAEVVRDVPLIYLVHLPDVVIAGPGIEGVSGGPAGVFASAVHWRRTP